MPGAWDELEGSQEDSVNVRESGVYSAHKTREASVTSSLGGSTTRRRFSPLSLRFSSRERSDSRSRTLGRVSVQWFERGLSRGPTWKHESVWVRADGKTHTHFCSQACLWIRFRVEQGSLECVHVLPVPKGKSSGDTSDLPIRLLHLFGSWNSVYQLACLALESLGGQGMTIGRRCQDKSLRTPGVSETIPDPLLWVQHKNMTSWPSLVRKWSSIKYLCGIGKVEGLRLVDRLLSFALIGLGTGMGP